MKKILGWLNKYILKATFIGLALFLIIDDIATPSIDGTEDLFIIESEVSYYSFIKKEGYRGPFYHYYFKLNDHKSTFQIKADFAEYFKKGEFEKDIKIGDKLIVSIPSYLKEELDNQGETILVMSIKSDKRDYLSQNLTMADESQHFPIFLGIGILLVVTFNHFIQWDRIKSE